MFKPFLLTKPKAFDRSLQYNTMNSRVNMMSICNLITKD